MPRGTVARNDEEKSEHLSPPGAYQWDRLPGPVQDSAFTMLEMIVVVTVAGVLAAMAIPQAYYAVKAYRLHADASALANQLNIARMRAASQCAPYREVVNASSGTCWREELCGDTSTSTDSACASAYNAQTTAGIEGGTQYAIEGDSFSSCRPSVLSAGSYPGTIQADPSPCPDPIDIYFNTRGAPVDGDGDPLGNGGAVVYVRNQYDLVDAVTVSIGGAVTVWNWDTASSSWMKR
ncbi:MAG TPA: prepilin-type N-terminal cleavage/methylation domain-containing protein [Terriglobia bacterium]|nr:prepilin-type N-terminal cleavage/methylation domain-containing protein [Terriglobia bacterium]